MINKRRNNMKRDKYGRALASDGRRLNNGSGERALGIVVAVIVVILLLGVLGGSCTAYTARKSVTATVESKERCNTDDSCNYLIYTDKGTFQLSDSLVIQRWDTADLYGKLKVGKTYDIDYYGWRFGFFSMMPNITDFKEVKQ